MKNCVHIAALVLVMVVSVVALDRNPSAEPFKIALTGVVYDQNGAVIVSARVAAYGSDRKTYEANTNDEGIYQLWLPPGYYKVEVGAPGFCPTIIKRFFVVDSTYRKMSQDFVLIVRDNKCEDETPNKRKQRRPDRKKNPIEIIE